MIMFHRRFFHRCLLSAWAAGLGLAVHAQPAGLLYDPEPPADSAYVRVLVAGNTEKVAITVDGKVRVPSLPANQVSDYMVLTAGKHVLGLQLAGQTKAAGTMTLDVTPGRATTLGFAAAQLSAAPAVFEDKTGANKLKAMLAVYPLVKTPAALDILTADGTTKVFSNISYGASSALPVNPITVDLIAAKAGDKSALAKASLEMKQSSSYSVFLLPDRGGKIMMKVFQNKTERYTGKPL